MPLNDKLRSKDIDELESLALACAFSTFPDKLAGKNILCFVDNTAVQFGFQNRKAKKLSTLLLVRHTLIWAARSRTYFFTEYISTKENRLADLLSRLRIDAFKAHAKKLRLPIDPNPTPIVLPFSIL